MTQYNQSSDHYPLLLLYIFFPRSFISWESALAKCTDLGGTLPLLDSAEDMKLFSKETDYLTIIYLGATINQSLNSSDHYVWTDQSRSNFLENAYNIYSLSVDVYNASTQLSRRIMFPYKYGSGRCIALMYYPPVFAWKSVSIPCNVSLNVSLYCSFKEKDPKVYNETLSTLRIGLAKNSFTTIEKGRYCSSDYEDGIHWFQQEKTCLHTRRCPGFVTEYDCCHPYEYYDFQYDTHSTFDKSSNAAKFLSLFKSRHSYVREYTPEVLLAVKYDNLTEIRNKPADVFLMVPVESERYKENYLWAIQGTIQIVSRIRYDYYPIYKQSSMSSTFFVMCEKNSSQPHSRPCHHSYFQCKDGTCVDDHLVCDGKSHCMHAEDEANCTQICTANDDCAEHCTYINNCHCIRGYFQCQSGGCVSVAKLCDGVSNCRDGSDEPTSCFFGVMPPPLPTYIKELVITGPDENIGTKYLVCNDDVYQAEKLYMLSHWCIYSYIPTGYKDYPYSSIPTGYKHYPCENGYHLSSCESMHCINTFKCHKSYCLERKYVCDNMCDCPHCDDESICKNASCPHMILHESAHGKVYCDEQANHRLAAVIIKSAVYDLYAHAQSAMCSQVLNCHSTITTWNNIVYLDLVHGNHLVDHSHVTEEMMQFLIYCNITYYNLEYYDAKYLTKMTAVQYLDLSHNNIIFKDDMTVIFSRMIHLVYLDLSSNLISHFEKSLLSVSSNLQFLFLQNNSLIFIHSYAFHLTTKLRVLHLHNNELLSSSLDSNLLQQQCNLIHVMSDLPRLCCMIQADIRCYPEFTLFVTCSDMIHSQFHVFLAWTIGGLTSICNAACILLQILMFCRLKNTINPIWSVQIMSFNITLADMMVSVCLLLLSIYNVYYQGAFGVYADAWRESIACYSLEVAVFACSECSLIFSVYITVDSYKHISSLVHRTHSMKPPLRTTASVWLSAIALGCCKLMVWEQYHANDFNYYCLPFQIIKVESFAIKGIQTGIIIINMVLIGTYIFVQFYLFKYIYSHTRKTRNVLKSKIPYHKIAVRASCLIISNVITWTPIFVTQLFIMFWKDINPTSVLLVLLVSLPANLLVNPIIVIVPLFSKIRCIKPKH